MNVLFDAQVLIALIWWRLTWIWDLMKKEKIKINFPVGNWWSIQSCGFVTQNIFNFSRKFISSNFFLYNNPCQSLSASKIVWTSLANTTQWYNAFKMCCKTTQLRWLTHKMVAMAWMKINWKACLDIYRLFVHKFPQWVKA